MKELEIGQFNPSLVGSFIERAKDELLGPDGFLRRYAGRLDDYLLEVIYNVYKRYQEILERSNSLDFADLIRLTVRLLRENLQVLELYRERFRFILIDEYQDINYAQYIFARLLAERYGNICVVGDDDQAIYGWRGADPGWLLRFEEDFPKAKVVRLRLNYRSPRRILRAAQTLIENNELRKEKELEAIKDEGPPIRLYAALDGLDEAHYVAAEIERLRQIEGVELGEIAVLYRVNTLSRAMEEALVAHGIPYEVVRGLRFYERMEVKDLICYLRLVVNPADELSLLRVINRPRRGIGKRTIATIQSSAEREGLSLWEALERSCDDAPTPNAINTATRKRLKEFVLLIEELRLRTGELGPDELAEEILERTGYLESLQSDPAAEERLGNIKELLGQLRGYRSLEEFLEGVALLSEADYESPEGRVALMTLHAAKGLEFDVVFIIGLEEGLLPHSRAIQEGGVEEERRLAYVGMTRAKQRLYLSFAVQRSLYGSLMENPPSRFLAELPQGELEGFALGLRPQGF
jgi:DNA helicase-2/ATP-dependent DNA helicase PcrA